MTGKRLVLLVCSVVLLSLAASAVLAQLPAGKKAPNFTLKDINGKSFTLSNLYIKPVKAIVLDLWATWCPPCRKEVPFLIDINKRYKSKGVIVVGVSIDRDLATVKKFVNDYKIDYTILHDPNATKVGPLYNLKPIPETYIIDKKGIIRYVHVGFSGKDDEAKIESEIKKLL